LWKSILHTFIIPPKNHFRALKIGNFIPEHDSAISRNKKNVEVNHFRLTLMGKLGKIAMGLFFGMEEVSNRGERVQNRPKKCLLLFEWLKM